MIRFDIAYELVDLRPPTLGRPVLAPAAMLFSGPGVLDLVAANGRGFQITLTGEDEEEQLELRLDQVVIHTETGEVVLTPMTAQLYERRVRPFLGGPRLLTDEAVQEHMRTLIQQVE